MAAITENDNRIDVICQHTRDARIVPIKIRVRDEDGEMHNYMVKGYRDISRPGVYATSGMQQIERYDYIYECKVVIFERVHTVKIMYNSHENLWYLL